MYGVLHPPGRWPISLRFSQFFDSAAKIVIDDGARRALEDMILFGLELQVVINYGSEIYKFSHWCCALGLTLSEVSDLRIAGYIRNSLDRGKTVPGRIRNALCWFQRLADLHLGVEKIMLSKMVRSSSGSSGKADPEPAPMIPPDVVKLLELGCSRGRTGVIKVFCGLCCLLTFGVKRWSDAQRVESIELKEDAIVIKS